MQLLATLTSVIVLTISVNCDRTSWSPESQALTCYFKNYTWCNFTHNGGWQIDYDPLNDFFWPATNQNEAGGTIASVPLNNTSPVCFTFSYYMFVQNCPVHYAPINLTVTVEDKVLFAVTSNPNERGWKDGNVTIAPGKGQMLKVVVVKDNILCDSMAMMPFQAHDGAC